MSITFLDITYVIIFGFVQCSTAMVLKSSKCYISRYIKQQSESTFYFHNPYKARKSLDYNYQDWEEKKPDIYDYLLPTKNHTSSKASHLNINETSPQEIFQPEIPTNPILESSAYNTLYSSSATYPTLPSNESTPDTSLPTPSILSTPLPILPSFSTSYNTTTPYNTTMTILTPEISTANIIIVTTTPPEILIETVSQSIGNAILDAKVKFRTGFFTASIYVLLKIIEKKKSEDVTPLLVGLQEEFSRLNSQHRLAMFGPMVISFVTVMVSKMTKVPVKLIQKQAKNGQELLENKKVELDTKAIFDVVDAIFIEDYIRVVDSLTDIQNFPNISKRAIKVAQEAIAAFILLPYTRLEETEKDKLLVMIQNFVGKTMAVDENKTIRRYFRNHVKINNEMLSSETKFRGKKNTKAKIRKAFVWSTTYTDPTTIISSEKDYTSYDKVSLNMTRLDHKMRIYKYKFRQSSAKERKFKRKKGMLSTTTITTEMPEMHKSKYYMRKYVKQLVYKMKISTPKTTRIGWRYGTDAIKSMIQTKLKNNVIKGKESKMELEDNHKIQRFDNKPDSSDSNAEAYIKVNLNDAIFHTNKITIDRRFRKKKVNKLLKMDSFSDNEAILKGNIYKVFGYSNDFSKQLRAVL